MSHGRASWSAGPVGLYVVEGKRKRSLSRAGLSLALLLLATVWLAGRSSAEVYMVDRGDDSAAFAACNEFVLGDCTLRGAILAANANAGPDVITFDHFFVSIVLLSVPKSAADSPSDGDLDITEDLVVDGDFGTGMLIAAADGFNDRIFDVGAGVSVTFLDLIITGGNAAGFCGGGIEAAGDTFLQRVEVTGNQATGGAGICKTGSSQSTLFLARSSVIGNTASGRGGGIELQAGSLELHQSTISGNTAANFGGAVFVGISFGSLVAGPVSLEHVTLTENTTTNMPNADFYLHDNNLSAVVEVVGSVIDGACHDPNFRITSLGGNLEGPGDTCGLDPTIDQIGVPDMRLEPLDYDPTIVNVLARSHRPRWNSPAVDDPLGVLTTCPASDQRFQLRPQDGDDDGVVACDSGSVEALPPIFVDGFDSGDLGAWSSSAP